MACSLDDEWAKWTSTAKRRTRPKRVSGGGATGPRPGQALRHDKRRVAPPWSVPNEVWVQVLLPDWRRKTDAAMGASNQKPEVPLFRELLARTLAQTIATKQAPLIAHRSKGADVAKTNGKLRLLHVLCPFWTQVYSVWFKAWENSQQPLHWEHGFFRHKRREEAIMICEMAGEETKHTGLSAVDALHDATNAFASTTTTAYQETIHRHAAPYDHPYHDLFLQMQRNACVDIQDANGHVQLRPTMGNLMGDRFVPCAFALTYRRSILRYTVRSVAARRLLRKLPWVEDTPSAIDVSTVVFADDVRVVHPVEINLNSTPSLEARRFMDFVVREAGCLSEELAKEGYAQNMGKAEILPRLHGTGSHIIKREHTSYRAGPGEPKVVLEARHLGPYCHHQYKAHLERDRRIASRPGRLRTVEICRRLHHQALGPHRACTPLRCRNRTLRRL